MAAHREHNGHQLRSFRKRGGLEFFSDCSCNLSAVIDSFYPPGQQWGKILYITGYVEGSPLIGSNIGQESKKIFHYPLFSDYIQI